MKRETTWPDMPAPYDYLAECRWLDLLAEREVLRLRARYELSQDELRGFYISDAQVDHLLRQRGVRISSEGRGEDPLLELEQLASACRHEFAAHSPLQRLVQRWPLAPLQADLLLLALAPELDIRYESFWAYLNNDITRKHLTLELAQRLLGGPAVLAQATLLRAVLPLCEQGLLQWLEPGAGRSRWLSGVQLSEPTLAFLWGTAGVPTGMPGSSTTVRQHWQPAPAPAALPPLVEAIHCPALLLAPQGQHAPWVQQQAAARGLALCWVELPHWPEAAVLRALELQARLAEAVLALALPLGAAGEDRQAALQALPALTFQAPVWLCAVPGSAAAEEAAVLGLPALTRATDASEPAELTGLARIATRVQRQHDSSQLVLAPSTHMLMQEVAAAITSRHRVHDAWGLAARSGRGRGLSVLFCGPSGTGKTMAACVLARQAGLPLYRIDLAGVVSKYIGETEKNLERVFSAARQAEVVLLFDEADALLGKRSDVKDAHDRYANLEVAYLLQRIEEHDGVVILASNLPKNIDTAFARRLHYVVEFPRPGPELRERIWRGLLAPPTPVAPGVDPAHLAEAYELSGGEIQNLLLEAAFAAAAGGQPITQAGLERVLRRQQTRQGRAHAGSGA
jgi:hypothetical protein